MLLQAAEEATDEEIAATLRVGLSTVHRTRQRFVEEGLPSALTERRRPWARPQTWMANKKPFSSHSLVARHRPGRDTLDDAIAG